MEQFQLTGEDTEAGRKEERKLPSHVADAKRRKRLAEEEETLAWIDVCIAENDLRKARDRLEQARRDRLVAINDLSRMGTNGNKSPVRAHNRKLKKAQANLI